MAEENAPKITPAKLWHIALRTNNLQPMTKWYRHMLAADILYEDSNVAFLRCDQELIRVAIIQLPNTADKNAQSNGLEHFAFTFETLADLCNVYKERKALGYLPYRAVHHGPTLSMYYYDPDGNKMEMQTEILTTADEFKAYIASGALARNPVGSEMEADEILRIYESGRGDTLMDPPEVEERGFEHIK
jgi:catechol 2,3-dioxygenase-like lactoylglutathione lyase family enzyme